MSGRFVTALGCHMSVFEAPEHLGKGVILEMRMPLPDGRRSEVFLNDEDRAALIAALAGADA